MGSWTTMVMGGRCIVLEIFGSGPWSVFRTGLLGANRPTYRKGIDMAFLVHYYVLANQDQAEEHQDMDDAGDGEQEEDVELNSPRAQAFFRRLGMDWVLPN